MSSLAAISTLMAFFEEFPDERSCEKYLFDIKYPNGFRCPRCGSTRHAWVKGRREYQCSKCGHQESATAGTALHKTHLPLKKWFLAIYLVTHDKRAISALALKREIGVTYSTAYRMLATIRAAMADRAIPNVLSGEVELDDSYIGASGGKRGRGTDKQAFIIAAEKSKGGSVVMRAVESLAGADYKEFARYHVTRSAHIMTDGLLAIRSGLSAWSGLDSADFDAEDGGRSLPVVHHIISNFKAMVDGTYHGVRKAFLQGYMDEFSYRYNHRNDRFVFARLLKRLYLTPRRTYPTMCALFSIQPSMAEKKAA